MKPLGRSLIALTFRLLTLISSQGRSQGHRSKVTTPATFNLCNVATIFGLKTADCSNKRISSVPDSIDFDIQVMPDLIKSFQVATHSFSDGWLGWWMVRWMDGWTNEWTDGRRLDGSVFRKIIWMDGWLVGYVYGWLSGEIDGWKNEWTDGQIEGWIGY